MRFSRNILKIGPKGRSSKGLPLHPGDGGVDIEPIAHLYKSQIYML